MRIEPERVLHDQPKRLMAAAEVHRPGRDQDRQTLTGDDHAAPRSARTRAAARSADTSPGTRNTSPSPISIPTTPSTPSVPPVGAPASGLHRHRHKGWERAIGQPFHGLRRQRQKPLPRLTPPGRKLMRRKLMPPRDIHHPRTGLKTLRHDPRLQRLRPAPVPPRPPHHLDPATKPIPTVRHDTLLPKRQKEARRSPAKAERRISMRRRRRLRCKSAGGRSFLFLPRCVLFRTPSRGHKKMTGASRPRTGLRDARRHSGGAAAACCPVAGHARHVRRGWRGPRDRDAVSQSRVAQKELISS